MKRRIVFIATVTIGLFQVSYASAGLWGVVSNDTGGIIPWSPATETAAFEIAAEHCAWYQKYARINSVHRIPGDYITFACVWSPYVRP